MLNEFVQQHRLSVYDTYIDDGWSGTSFDRPDFQRMIGDIEAKKVNMVITKDLSRLGRDYIMTGHYMERYFPEKRVRYISLLDGIDIGVESTANDITPFRAIMNDMYAKDISKKLQPIAADAMEKARQTESHEAEIQSLHSKIDSLTANLDKIYMDRLTGLLAESDFERIYQRVKMERSSLEEKLKELEAQKESPVSTEDRARELVQQFLDSAYTSRELLVSLIERVELTEDKQIIIKFRFRELEAIS